MAIYETISLNYSEEKYEQKIEKEKNKLKDIGEDNNYDIIAIEKRLKDGVIYIRFLHKECNTEFHMRGTDFFNKKQRCPECNGTKKYTLEDVKKIVENNTNNEYSLLSNEVNGVKNNIMVKHNKCGKEYPVRLSHFIEGNRCKECTREKIYNERIDETDEKYTEKINSITNGEYIKIGTYTNHNIPFLVKHTKCGHEWKICGYDFVYNGHRCPKCFNKKSNKEKELVEFIKSLNFEIECNYRPKFLNGKEIDIYIPSKNIGIEFNGLYWHSEEGSHGKCDKKYHLNKMELCNKNNLQLIQITEDEWDNKKDIVKSKLKHILGLHDRKIYARNCYVKELDSKTRNEFLDENHIQGRDRCNISLGLFTIEDNKLVSVMSFVKPRKSLNGDVKKYDYELSRFASLKDYNVIGAFSKIFKYFKLNYEWNKIITYADLRWSLGNVYKENNWKFLRNSKPSYSYINKNSKNLIREFRFKYRKQELKNLFPDIYSEQKTEIEIMNEAGFVRYWDCGNMVFEYER